MSKNNKNVNIENSAEKIKEQEALNSAENITESVSENIVQSDDAEDAAAERDAKKDNADAENPKAADSTEKEKPDDSDKRKKADAVSGKSKRLKHGALAITFTVLFVTGIVLLNIIFNMLLDRFDISADLSDKAMYSIDPTTADYLSKVDDEISIIVTTTEDEFSNLSVAGIQVGQQVSQIIKSFVAANIGFSSEYRSLDDNPTFYAKYGATLASNSIIVESKKTGRNRIITSSDYLSPKYYLDGQEISSNEYYYYSQMGLESTGRLNYEFFAAAESTILTSIMIVTNEDPIRVAYIDGDYSASEPAALTSLLEANAYTVEGIKLTTAEKIDPEIDFLIINAPVYDFSNDDINKIDVWLDNGGKYGKNLLYAAAVTIDVLPNLNKYLNEWGLSLESGFVYQTNTDYGYAAYPTYQMLDFVSENYNAEVDTVTKTTQGDGLKAITLLFDEQSNYVTSSIISSYSGAVLAPFDMENFDPSKAEKTGEFVVAAESCKSRYEGVTPFSSRVFVLGSNYLLDQSFLQANSVNNADIMLNIFNVSCGKDKVEIAITPKSFTQETFAITATQVKTIAVIFVIVVPLVIVAVGIVVIVKRKRR